MSQPDFQPTLTGEIVVVRPILADDWQKLFNAASDPEIWKLHPVQDRYTEPVFRDFFDGAIKSKMAFVLVDRATGRLIGSSRYHGYDADLSVIEIGWTFIVRDHWGGRTNREVKRLMLEHAFGFVETVVFWVGDCNLRSQRAVEKIGGVRRSGLYYREGSSADPYFVFAIARRNYRNNPALLR